jgi:hypothetical protein
MKRIRKKPTEIELEVEAYVKEYNAASDEGKDTLKCVVWGQRYKWDQILQKIGR